jgi:hypothetical protein
VGHAIPTYTGDHAPLPIAFSQRPKSKFTMTRTGNGEISDEALVPEGSNPFRNPRALRLL